MRLSENFSRTFFYPGSYFISNLAVARPLPDRRYGLRSTVLTIHIMGGESEQQELTSVAEFRTVPERIFQLTLPETPQLDIELQRLIDEAAAAKITA